MSGKKAALLLYIGPVLGTLMFAYQVAYPTYAARQRLSAAWREYQTHGSTQMVKNTLGEELKAHLVWRSFDNRVVICIDNQTSTRYMVYARPLESRDNFRRPAGLSLSNEVLVLPRTPTIVELPFRPQAEARRLWVEIELELQQEEAAEETKILLEGLVSVN